MFERSEGLAVAIVGVVAVLELSPGVVSRVLTMYRGISGDMSAEAETLVA